MDNVQNCDSYINIPSSQTYRFYLRIKAWINRHNLRDCFIVYFVPELKKRCDENSVTFVLPVLYSTSAHDLDDVSLYSDIGVVFLSPRTTSVMDTVDLFVITVLKAYNLKLIAGTGTRNDNTFGKDKSSQNQSHITTDSQSASLGVRRPIGTRDQFYFLLEIFFL
jgi:hypothetical protein